MRKLGVLAVSGVMNANRSLDRDKDGIACEQA